MLIIKITSMGKNIKCDELENLRKLSLKQMIENRDINKFLYKYRVDNQNSEMIVTEHKLWFANPNTFNDPFDCKARVIYKKEDSESWCSTHNIQVDVDNFNLEAEINKKLEGIGILSLAQAYDNPLMWANYADCHRGLCFEFDILCDESCCFTLAKEVKYVEEMPEYNHCIEPENLIEKVIVPKLKAWEKEEEVRIIKTMDEIKQNSQRRDFQFSPKALKSIYFGCKMPKSRRKIYMDLCKANGLEHVKFYSMELSKKGDFALEKCAEDDNSYNL